MTELKTQINFFSSPDLNKVGAELIDLYKSSAQHIQQAKEHFESATHRRWKCGKLVAENIDIIESETTQREFAEMLGITEAMVSNDKRSFVALQNEGGNTWDEAKKILQKKGIKQTTRLWEKLPKLLNDPKNEIEKDRRAKDERRLQQLESEVEEIKARNEGANPSLAEQAGDTLRYTQAVEQHIGTQDVFKSGWRSRDYLDFVKSIGFDYLTGRSCGALDPHHTLPDGSKAGENGKVGDMFTIPVSRKTHEKIESGQLKPSKHELSEALLRTMALFIKTQMKSD